MGSCISKCKPRKKFKKEYCIDHQDFSHHVHDKLVISQAPISSSIHQPVSPSYAASTTSFSSVSGGNSCNTSTEFSLSASSSCSSSVSISKDRLSFSNEFLWACAKENPQIIGRNVIKGSHDQKYSDMSSTKGHPNKFDYPVVEKKQDLLPIKQAIQDSHGGTTPKKRARASSPTVVRQKSFRKEPDKVSSSNVYHLPNRTLLMRSPSPSRRFNGESLKDSPMNTTKEIYSRRLAVPKTNAHNSLSCPSMRRETFRTPPSPKYDLGKSSTMLKTRDALITQQIGPRNGKIGVEGKELANPDLEAMIIEDIHNPLIALDCFIFL